MLMAVALLVRRYYVKDGTPNNDLVKFLTCFSVIIGSSIGVIALWNSYEKRWIGYVIAAVLWLFGTLGMALTPKEGMLKILGLLNLPSVVRNTSWFNWVSSIVSAFVIVFEIVVGFVHSKRSNLVPFFSIWSKGCFPGCIYCFPGIMCDLTTILEKLM
ncbi:hypothetical protein CFOL_v3_00956 [Cephalotus follicularis]|uniref:Uncharacterized protein n=1 Tax=Cephalotus follicularis TaxID=3775 RepID=A0A1Q3ANV8_CEPFO|nr:hypothetical protein CFOL_v3_00956 [Cephalotus follicularis]